MNNIIKNLNILFSEKENISLLNINSKYKYSSGFDERYSTIIDTDNNIVELYKIQNLFCKKRLLDILKNENISINTKIELLEDNNIKGQNILCGLKNNETIF